MPGTAGKTFKKVERLCHLSAQLLYEIDRALPEWCCDERRQRMFNRPVARWWRECAWHIYELRVTLGCMCEHFHKRTGLLSPTSEEPPDDEAELAPDDDDSKRETDSEAPLENATEVRHDANARHEPIRGPGRSARP